MKLGLSHSHRMEQRLIQSPQMIQAMQILQLSGLDLQDRVEQELLENPFLERVEGQVEGADRNGTPAAEEEAVKVEAEPSLRDSIADDFERMRASEDLPGSRRIDQEASDRKHEAMSNAPDRPRSLASALIDQIALADLDPRQREIAEFLIFSLDHRGYLPDSLEELALSLQVHHPATRPIPEFVEDLGLEHSPSAAVASSPAAPEDEDPEGGAAGPTIAPVGVRELEHVLHLVRRATHPALGAVDLQDCLLLQLEAHGIDSPLVLQLVEHHLDDLVKNRLPRIAKANGQSLEEIKAAIAVLKELDPIPARDYGEAVAAVIVPDVVLEELDGRLEVRLGRRRAPGLQVSPDYRELLEGLDDAARHADSNGAGATAPAAPEPELEPAQVEVDVLPPQEGPAALEAAALGGDQEAELEQPTPTRSEDYARLRENEDPKKWARRRLESARWFLDAVEQRGNTMLRIARAIFTHQYAFLEKGPKGLVPLRMQEVADETGVHISTVSRAVAGKHVQTPRGIFPLKYFFTSGTTDESGAAQSQVSIQQRIAELVEGENTESPLSDDQLAAELQKRFGIKIARRTVTKYRKALSIPSSSQRKHF